MSRIEPGALRPRTRARVFPALLAAAFALLLLLVPRASFAFTPNGGIDGINPVQIVPEFPCNTQDVRLLFTICTCNSRFVSVERVDSTLARLDIEVNPLIACVQCQPDTLGLDLGRFPVGTHVMNADIAQHIVAGPDSGQVHVEHFALQFEVHGCPEPPNPLPFVTDVDITAYCDSCTQEPCNGDSIYVRLEGVFTDACYGVVELRALPNPSLSPLPQPDIVRIVYEHACEGCPTVLTPWEGALPIGPLPGGSYGLPIEVYLIDRCRGNVPEFLGHSVFPFNVGTCYPPANCAIASFQLDLSKSCETYVAPDAPGEVTFGVASPVPVGGVQGRFVFDQDGLRVIGIEPVIQGTLLKWDPTPRGANFVAVLPPAVPVPTVARGLPLLRVKVALEPGASLEGTALLTPMEILISDTHGVELPPCTDPHLRLTTVSARICSPRGCDFNHDGRPDVRDLVIQAGCLYHRYECPADIDCDGNGQRNLDDVLCCARTILGGPRPDSTGAVAAPEVRVTFGEPIPVAGGLDVPVYMIARARVGAARLSFTYPDAAFASASIELFGSAPSWLVLDEGGGGTLRLGAIKVGDDLQITQEIDRPLVLMVHLRTRAGQSPAGALAFVGGDFAAPDGSVLLTSAAPLSMPLSPGLQFAVSAPYPNPFAGATRFSIALTQHAELDVAVYELNGRKVATLWKGIAMAGTRDLVWRRTRDDGSVVPSGVYFIRATSGGESRSTKVLVLSRN